MAIKKNYKNGSANFKHGATTWHTKSPEYITWSAMWDRCRNGNNKRFSHYGGRGITVCARWKDFALFLADMGERPSSEHTIERENNDGNYEPENCRWATRQEQNNNQSHTQLITLRGRTLSVSAWAREIGIARESLRDRIVRGMSPQEAITKIPAGHGYRRKECQTSSNL